jgi:hypothetical protein
MKRHITRLLEGLKGPKGFERHLTESRRYFVTSTSPGAKGAYAHYIPSDRVASDAARKDGFKLHVSIKNPAKANEMVKLMSKFLKKEDVPHKFIKSEEQLRKQVKGLQAGKDLTIYPGNSARLVDLADRMDKTLIEHGFIDHSPRRPLGSRGIGESGHISYRYAAGDTFFKQDKTRGTLIDPVAKTWEGIDKAVKDMRTPGIYMPFSGSDEVETLARHRGLKVEDMRDFHVQVDEHLEHLEGQVRASGDELAIKKVRAARKKFEAVREDYESGDAVTFDPDIDGELHERRKQSASKLHSLYQDITKMRKIQTSSGSVEKANKLNGMLREHVEEPLVRGERISRKDLRFVTRNHGLRDRVWKIIEEAGAAEYR